MEARFKRIRQLFGRPGVQFVVPDYQRGYEWKQKHLEDLWNDLQRIGDGIEFHYLGNIIFRREEGGDRFEIVDGQQRMISLSLLMLAIRDSPNVDVERDRRFDDILYSYEADVRERKIIYNDKSSEYGTQFHQIWEGNADEVEGSIKDAYDYFSRKLAGLEEDKLDEIAEKVGDNLRVVETIADDTRIAYMIFQSQNERGTEVTPEILAKARIFGEAEQLEDTEKRRVIGRWEAIYDQLERKLGGPRFRSDLRVRRPLTQILINSEYETPTQIDKGELYRNFDKILRKHPDTLDFVQWFQDQVENYLDVSSNSYDIHSRNIPKDAVRHLQYLNAVSTHSEVLSLTIYNRVDDDKLLKEYFRLASILGMRMELAGYASASKRDAIYTAARNVREAEDINAIRDRLKDAILTESPTNPEIIEHVKANDMNIRGSWNFRTLLKLVSIEEARRSDRSRLPLEDLHIEHVAPRNTFGNSKYAEWRRKLDEEEFDERKDMIGNLTLLLPDDHASLDETSFTDKKNTYTNSDIQITEEIAKYDDWSDEDIDERTERLARELTERWDI